MDRSDSNRALPVAAHPTLLGDIPQVDSEVLGALIRERYGLEGRLSALAGERDSNFVLETTAERVVVKVAHADEDPAVLDMQAAAMVHLEASACGLETPVIVPATDGSQRVTISSGGIEHGVRLTSYVGGEPLRSVGGVEAAAIGIVVAQMQKGLAGFFHPTAGRALLWDLRRLQELRTVLDHVGDAATRRLVERVLDSGDLAGLDHMPSQVMHNDLNPDNILIVDGRPAGVIDFGDMVHGPRVMDLAMAMAYHPAEAMDTIRSAYEAHILLSEAERALLPRLVMARLCQSIVIGSWRAAVHAGNADYITADIEPSVQRLAVLAAGAPRNSAPLLERRRHVVAPSLRTSYVDPIRLVAGHGATVVDDQGVEFLDAYNNVAQLGHGDAEIVRTVAEHTRRLNTNTRYLTAPLIDVAERLVSLLPEPLDTCLFTASGSEANDLAVRIARAVTGNSGVIVTSHAYHGSTTTTAALSPEEHGAGRSLEPWVATMAAPDGDSTGTAAHGAVDLLAQHGHGLAAILVDTVFSSDGIHDAPASYFSDLASAARSAGGLFIADEVQAGLGRVGSRFWGFASGDSVPTMVTLGKPLGNGYPVGAVVTTAEIAERFAQTEHFFSTFGGSTVAAAVMDVVLRRTVDDGLADRAEVLGRRIRSALAGVEGSVAAVRGPGLMIGVEVADGEISGEERAGRAVESMKQAGVLIGRTGPRGSVLKIRPSLAVSESEVDRIIEALRTVLSDA